MYFKLLDFGYLIVNKVLNVYYITGVAKGVAEGAAAPLKF